MVPAIPPIVTTSGSATAPTHTALVEDAHDVVEHSAAPSRPEGVVSEKAKLSPMTERQLVTSEVATLATASRALMTGADECQRLNLQNFGVAARNSIQPSKVNTTLVVPTRPADTVTTTLRSAGEPVVLCMHATLVPDVHDAVLQAPSAACTVAVASVERKLSPATVMLSDVEKGRFAEAAALTVGAVVGTTKERRTGLVSAPSRYESNQQRRTRETVTDWETSEQRKSPRETVAD